MAALIGAIFLFPSTKPLLAEERDALVRMDLEVGESLSIAVPTNSEVKLSRKGLIHLERQNTETFLLVGLREGYVLIRAESAEDRKLYGVFVHPQSKERVQEFKEKDHDSARNDIGNHPMSSQGGGPGAEAEGTFDLAAWLHTLDSRWIDLQQTGEHSYVRQVCKSTEGDSPSKKIPKVIQNELQRRNIPQICFLQDQRNHRLDLLVILMKGNEAELWSLNDVLNIVKGQIEIDRIQARQELRRELVVNEPSLVFRLGERTEFTSGGEMEALVSGAHDRDEQESYWKPFGLSFHFEATQLLDASLELDYKLKLTLPSQQRGRFTLQGASAESLMVMKGDEYVLLGSFDIQSSSHETNRDTIYGRVPILWPLFQSQNKQDAYSQIIVLAKIGLASSPKDASKKAPPPDSN
jgi:hypothetical protein